LKSKIQIRKLLRFFSKRNKDQFEKKKIKQDIFYCFHLSAFGKETKHIYMRILLATCTVYTWLIGHVSIVTGTIDTRSIVEFFVVERKSKQWSLLLSTDGITLILKSVMYLRKTKMMNAK
jgi:hypothetical protein